VQVGWLGGKHKHNRDKALRLPLSNKHNLTTTTMKQETTFTLLTQVLNLWQQETELAIAKYKLSQPEFALLASLHSFLKEGKSATQVDVCKHSGITQMNASILLRKLQTRKFIQRKEHLIDTRAKTVQLTEIGEQVAIDILNELNKLSTTFFQISKNNENELMKKLQEIVHSKK
jgi:MarR family transcriptional regulator, organic hydroperoxide resistance regulator